MCLLNLSTVVQLVIILVKMGQFRVIDMPPEGILVEHLGTEVRPTWD